MTGGSAGALILLLLKAADLLFLLFALYSVILAFRDGGKTRPGGHVLAFKPWLSAAVLVPVGAAAVIGLLPIEGAWLLCPWTIVLLYLICIAANQRLLWDAEGFWYRTAFRRTIRFEYSDLRRARTAITAIGTDFRFRAGRRLIILDGLMPWDGFVLAYDAWRVRNGLLPFRQEREKRWLENYRRHGPFRRKLDRIPNGMTHLIVLLTGGAAMAGLALYGLIKLDSRDIGGCIGGIFLLLCGLSLPLTYIRGVSTMDKKLLRVFVRGRIHGDPYAQAKQYRKKK